MPSTGSELDASSSKYFPDVSEDKTDTTPQQPCGVSSDSQKVSSDPKIGPTMQFSFKDLMKRRKQRLAILQLNATASRHMEMQRYPPSELPLKQEMYYAHCSEIIPYFVLLVGVMLQHHWSSLNRLTKRARQKLWLLQPLSWKGCSGKKALLK